MPNPFYFYLTIENDSVVCKHGPEGDKVTPLLDRDEWLHPDIPACPLEKYMAMERQFPGCPRA